MRKVILGICFGLFLALIFGVAVAGAAETRGYTEKVTVPIADDEYSALVSAKRKAQEQALLRYVKDVYKNRDDIPDLGGDEKYIADLEVLESQTSGVFSKELTARIRVTINENAVRDYLERQGSVVPKNERKRVFVLLIPGKLDSGDADAVLDDIRAEVRSQLTAAEFDVIDSEEQTKRLESLVEGKDYSMVSQLDGLGEWLVLGKVDTYITKDGSLRGYYTDIVGKAVNISNKDLLFEAKFKGTARASANDPQLGLRSSATDGGKKFGQKLVSALQTKTLTKERRGDRFEVVFKAGGNYKLERKILKLMKEGIPGLKDVSEKNRGKGDMIVDLYYAGKISDLVDLLVDNFEKDADLKKLNPQKEGNKLIFQ